MSAPKPLSECIAELAAHLEQTRTTDSPVVPATEGATS